MSYIKKTLVLTSGSQTAVSKNGCLVWLFANCAVRSQDLASVLSFSGLLCLTQPPRFSLENLVSECSLPGVNVISPLYSWLFLHHLWLSHIFLLFSTVLSLTLLHVYICGRAWAHTLLLSISVSFLLDVRIHVHVCGICLLDLHKRGGTIYTLENYCVILKKKSTEMMGGTCEEISARKIKEEMKWWSQESWGPRMTPNRSRSVFC